MVTAAVLPHLVRCSATPLRPPLPEAGHGSWAQAARGGWPRDPLPGAAGQSHHLRVPVAAVAVVAAVLGVVVAVVVAVVVVVAAGVAVGVPGELVVAVYQVLMCAGAGAGPRVVRGAMLVVGVGRGAAGQLPARPALRPAHLPPRDHRGVVVADPAGDHVAAQDT